MAKNWVGRKGVTMVGWMVKWRVEQWAASLADRRASCWAEWKAVSTAVLMEETKAGQTVPRTAEPTALSSVGSLGATLAG